MPANGRLSTNRKGHGALHSALFHLAPGILVLLVYLYLLAPLAAALGLPRQLTGAGTP